MPNVTAASVRKDGTERHGPNWRLLQAHLVSLGLEAGKWRDLAICCRSLCHFQADSLAGVNCSEPAAAAFLSSATASDFSHDA
jgi:hypothetical protein